MRINQKIINRHHGLVVLITIALLVLTGAIFANVGPVASQNQVLVALFGETDIVPPDALIGQTDNNVINQRVVSVMLDLLGSADGRGQQAGQPLLLNLLPDLEVQVNPTFVSSPAPGKLTWLGTVPGDPSSSIQLVRSDMAVAGTIRINQGLFRLTYTGANSHLLSQVPEIEPVTEHPPILIDQDGMATRQPGQPAAGSSTNDDGSVIDVLVVYTPAARNRIGGTASIEALVDLAIVETNQAYQNSQVNTTLNLVLATEINYNETTDIITDLARLQDKTDGFMDEVHSWRNDYEADMVSLLVDDSNYSPKYCGIAYLMTTLSTGFEAYAFSVVNAICATGYYSFGHELGHNMGSSHDRANTSGALFDYSFGYQDPSDSFRTIMAYNCPNGCPRIQNFSNPNIYHQGLPTGIDYAIEPSQAADNARSINEARFTVANWRQRSVPLPDPPLSPTNLQATTLSFSAIHLTWQNQANNADGILIEHQPFGGDWTQVAIVSPTNESYTDQGLMSEVEYRYRLRAYNLGGNSPYSNEASALTEAADHLLFYPLVVTN